LIIEIFGAWYDQDLKIISKDPKRNDMSRLYMLRFVVMFVLVLVSTSSFTYACLKENQTVVMKDGKPVVSCCSGLIQDPSTNKCYKDFSPTASIKNCTKDQECPDGSGEGCYPQTRDDVLNPFRFPPGPEREKVKAQKKELEKSTTANFFGFTINTTEQPDGSLCRYNWNCRSYRCEKFICKPIKMCRKAQKDEIASGDVQCEPPLFRTEPDGRCDYSADDKYPTHLSLIANVKVKEVDQKNCRYELSADRIVQTSGSEVETYEPLETAEIETIINASLKSLRALEWILGFANKNINDCLQLWPVMKGIGEEIVTKRKEIIEKFNTDLRSVEESFDVIISAQTNGSRLLSLDGEAIPESELAARRVNGVDGLKIMQRRVKAYQKMEQDLYDLYLTIQTKLQILNANLASWEDEHEEWTILDKRIDGEEQDCPNYTFYGGEIEDTISDGDVQYRDADKDDMKSYIENNKKTVLPENKDYSLWTNLSASFNFLQMITGNVTPNELFWTPVTDRGWGDSAFGNNREMYFLDAIVQGTNTEFGTYQNTHKHFLENFGPYFKSLKTSNGSSKNFIYEPELISTQIRGCFEESYAGNPRPKECEAYDQLGKQLADIAFAQYFAYAVHAKDFYEDFFSTKTTLRLKLLDSYENQLDILTQYYTGLVDLRMKQYNCFELVKQGILSPDSAKATTFVGGGSALKPNSDYGNYAPVGDGTKPDPLKNNSAPNKLTMGDLEFKFGDLKSNMDFKNAMDKSSGASSHQGSFASLGSGQGLSAELQKAVNERRKQKIANNFKSIKAGSNFVKNNDAARNAMRKLGIGINSNSSNLSGIGHGPRTGGFGLKDNVAAIGLENKDNSSDLKKSGSSIGPLGSESQTTFGKSKSKKKISMAENIGDYVKDRNKKPTLNAKEGELKDIGTNIVREINPESSTSLFDSISNAYYRNLERIFERRKTEEGEEEMK